MRPECPIGYLRPLPSAEALEFNGQEAVRQTLRGW